MSKPTINDQIDAMKRGIRTLVKCGIGMSDAVDGFRQAYIAEAMQQNGSRRRSRIANKCQVAKELGVHRNTLSRYLSPNGHAKTKLYQQQSHRRRAAAPAAHVNGSAQENHI